MALLALRLRGRLAPAPFVALALALVCVDLFRVGMGYNPAIDRDSGDVPARARSATSSASGPARFVSTWRSRRT